MRNRERGEQIPIASSFRPPGASRRREVCVRARRAVRDVKARRWAWTREDAVRVRNAEDILVVLYLLRSINGEI